MHRTLQRQRAAVAYIVYFKFVRPELNAPEHWWLGISPEGIGALGMLVNFAVAWPVAMVTAPPPDEIRALVEDIRVPGHEGASHEISA